ncbi:hypothetical protein B0H11DRAFT_2386295 [Mycena galericulata]|nr:hypothetical protein B0H11DRAFT_2386295 [Mycena galericulata]
MPSLLERVAMRCPPGTIVSTQALSMHRDASVFPSPETFRLERWLPSYAASKEGCMGDAEREEARLARMASHMMPFGTGSCICGGMRPRGARVCWFTVATDLVEYAQRPSAGGRLFGHVNDVRLKKRERDILDRGARVCGGRQGTGNVYVFAAMSGGPGGRSS